MASYNIIDEHGLRAGANPDAISVSPDWCLVVFRFANPLTYDRLTQASFSTLYSDGVKLRGDPLVLRDAVLHLNVSSSKNSHLTQLGALLRPNLNYLAEIMPGDWIFAWMAHDSRTIDAAIKAVQEGKAANGFSSGLKFMGRVGSCRKVLTQDPGGPRYVRYNLTASGFQEFDASLFYEPHLAENFPAIGAYFAALGLKLNELVGESGISVNLVLRRLLDLLLGQGVPRNLGLENGDDDLRSTTGLDAPYSYAVPTAVGSVLGKTQKSKPDLLAAADIIEFVYGRQEYDGGEFSVGDLELDEDQLGSLIGSRMNPRGAKGDSNRRFTGNDMLGEFLPMPPDFSGHSVWSILDHYLNQAVNEMYTCLRVNAQGKIVPTLVARQKPFSTEFAPDDPPVTKFLSLPRWVVDPILVRKVDVGRSDALRVNFVHVYGDDGPQTMNPVAGQIVLAPPYRDDLDIARNGLRPYMQTVANQPTENITGEAAKKWMAILADQLMGQQLTLTGLLEMVGVQAPICVGDNLEWDGAVFHIESVTHTASIEPGGKKSFLTTCALTHGLSADPKSTNLSLFAGIKPEDLTTHDPGLTVEGHNEISAPPLEASDANPAGEAPDAELSTGVA